MFTNRKKNKYKVTVLANNLDELITRVPSRFMRSLEQEMNISEQLWGRWCRRIDQIAGNCHSIFQLDCAPAHNNKRPQVWLKESLIEVCEKEIWPPSFSDCHRLDCITFGVSELRVNLKPHKKPRTYSQRSRRWWSPSTGTPWRRPARGLGQDQRSSSLLMAVWLNKLFLNMFLCNFAFTLLKSDDFQLCYVI